MLRAYYRLLALIAPGRFTDQLTGLSNCVALMRMAPVRRSGAHLLLDLDHFKLINHQYGHQIGDQLLRAVGRRLRGVLSSGETCCLARLGGDEFAVVLEGVTVEDADQVAQRLVAAVSEPLELSDGGFVSVTTSIGIAALGVDTLPRDVLPKADIGVYAAKGQGGGRVQVADERLETWTNRRRDNAARLATLQCEVVQLRHEARTDHKTGLANSRSFAEDLDRLDATSRRGGTPYCVVYCDIDRFGAYNTTHLHDAGDRALASVAHALEQTCRAGDRVYRQGGEELVVLLPGTDITAGRATAERLRRAVAALQLPHGGHPDTPTVTISAGVAEFTPSRHSAAGDVVHDADQAMLAAKAAGRNRVLVASAGE